MSKRFRRHPCPNPLKTAFPDKAAADTTLATIREAYGRAPVANSVPVRSYQCTCGRWHLTSQAMPYSAIDH